MLPIALQLYSVRDELQADFVGTLKKVKEFGYDGVEFAGLHGHSAEEVKAILDELGLVPISAHVSLMEMMGDPEGVISTYAKIGCKYIAIPYMSEERRPGAELFDTCIAEMKTVQAVMKKYDIVLLYHNHDFEFKTIDGEYLLDILYKTLPADVLQTQIDTCWANVGGVDPAAYILKYSGRAPLVHLKDFYIGGKLPEHMYELIGIERDAKEDKAESSFELRPVGHGLQNIPAIIDASEKAGAKWLIVEQDTPEAGSTPIKSVKTSIDYLRSL